MGIQWVIDYGFQTLTVTVVTYLIAHVKIQAKQYTATQSGVKVLLRDRLISAIHKCKKQGFVYIHELENITMMYNEYVKLGGNGTIVHMMKEVENLPTKTELH